MEGSDAENQGIIVVVVTPVVIRDAIVDVVGAEDILLRHSRLNLDDISEHISNWVELSYVDQWISGLVD